MGLLYYILKNCTLQVNNILNTTTMLGYLIVIAILGYLFVHMTMSILNWGIPETAEQPNLSAESGIMDEILSSTEGVRTTYGTQDEYYSGDLGDEN